MDRLTILLIIDIGVLIVLVGLLSYHIKHNLRERKKTEQIKQELDTERQKTNKFHLSIEEIRKLTKG